MEDFLVSVGANFYLEFNTQYIEQFFVAKTILWAHLYFFYKRKWYFVWKLFLPTVTKKSMCDWEKLSKFEAEEREFAKYLRLLEQFIRTAKVREYLLNGTLF